MKWSKRRRRSSNFGWCFYSIRHLLCIKITCASMEFWCTINDEYCTCTCSTVVAHNTSPSLSQCRFGDCSPSVPTPAHSITTQWTSLIVRWRHGSTNVKRQNSTSIDSQRSHRSNTISWNGDGCCKILIVYDADNCDLINQQIVEMNVQPIRTCPNRIMVLITHRLVGSL